MMPLLLPLLSPVGTALAPAVAGTAAATAPAGGSMWGAMGASAAGAGIKSIGDMISGNQASKDAASAGVPEHDRATRIWEAIDSGYTRYRTGRATLAQALHAWAAQVRH